MTDAKPRGEWWCRKCRLTLDGSNVTFEERCDTCGHEVEWVESLPTIQADLAALRERLAAAEALSESRRVTLLAKSEELAAEWKRAETAEALVRELATVIRTAHAKSKCCASCVGDGLAGAMESLSPAARKEIER